jgi:hypothetical protein
MAAQPDLLTKASRVPGGLDPGIALELGCLLRLAPLKGTRQGTSGRSLMSGTYLIKSLVL